MSRLLLCFCLFLFWTPGAKGQDPATYAKANAVRIEDASNLNDSIYQLLRPFRVILFGEMHGTNESAPFAGGMVNLLTNNGDSVLFGMEIPSSNMKAYLSMKTDSSIYKSDFFLKQPQKSGKETTSWASLIAQLNDNPRVRIFFFDIDQNESGVKNRDSLMAEIIYEQIKLHPTWKTITLSGNYHNKLSEQPTMAFYLDQHKLPGLCTLNMEYESGTCIANFGKGLELKQLGSIPNPLITSISYDQFFLFVPKRLNYPYHGFYFIRQITAATITPHE